MRKLYVPAALLLLAGCDVLEPETTAHRREAAVAFDLAGNQFAADFRQYGAGALLHEADWTRMARWGDSPAEPGVWRVRELTDLPDVLVASLDNAPTSVHDVRALRWDALPVLGPPVEILAHFWLPPAEQHPKVGVTWFMQEPDASGKLNAFAVVRNVLGSVNNSFYIVRMYNNTNTGVWFGKSNDGFEAGGWIWMRVRHTVGEQQGTIRYRAWQGALHDEPEGWDGEATSNFFGPHGGSPGPAISGKAGLIARGHPDMAGADLRWGAFTVGTGGAPAPPPPDPDEETPCSPSDLTVTRAEGPNEGSFLGFSAADLALRGLAPEQRRVDLEAYAGGGCAGLPLRWEVEDDPDDGFVSPSIAEMPVGTPTHFLVPRPARSTWPSAHSPQLSAKALGYRVRVAADDGGRVVASDWVRVRQDLLDVIRQEYIDTRAARGVNTARVPGRGEFLAAYPAFTSRWGPWPIFGDYCPQTGGCAALAASSLVHLVNQVMSRWARWSSLQPAVNSVYRNPVHHHEHMSKRPSNDSPHKYGTAIDFQTVDMKVCSIRGGNTICISNRDVYWTVLRNIGVALHACAEPYRVSGHGHVHFDVRDGSQPACARDWREYEDKTGLPGGSWQPDAAPLSVVANTAASAHATDWRARAPIVEVMLATPRSELPAGWESIALALLQAELDSPEVVADDEDEEYGEHLANTAVLAYRTQSAAAVPLLARLGIDVGGGIRQFVAKHPAAALPALEAQWAHRPGLRTDIVGTLGEMIDGAERGAVSLTEGNRARIDRLLLAASVDDQGAPAWALARVAGETGLAELLPLVESLVTSPPVTTPEWDLIETEARESLPLLRAAHSLLTPAERLRRLARLHSALCDGAAGARAGHCNAGQNHLMTAGRMLDQRATQPVASSLNSYVQLLNAALLAGTFSTQEHTLLTGNALTVLQP